jgi:hypothetical protein
MPEQKQEICSKFAGGRSGVRNGRVLTATCAVRAIRFREGMA